MKKKNLMTIVILAAVLAFSGCGTKVDREDIASDLEEISPDTEVGTYSDATDNAIPEHTEYVIENTERKTKITVNADIQSEGYNNMSVYEQKKSVMTEEEIRTLAESLFDDGKYTIKKPYWMRSYEELQEDNQFWLSQLTLNEYVNNMESLEIDEWLRAYEQEEPGAGQYAGELVEGQIIYEKGDTGRQECYLTGMVDEEEWELRYRSEPFMLEFKPVVEYSMKISSLDKTEADYGQNLLDYDSAEEAAYDALYKLGITDMEIAEITQLGFVEEDQYVRDGYIFRFRKKIGKVQGANVDNNMVSVLGGSERVAQEFAAICMDSNGFYWIDVYNRYENVEIMSESSNMLDFSQVDAIAQDYMSNRVDNILVKGEDYQKINRVKLSYLTVMYDDKYVLMPFWVYYVDWGENYYIDYDALLGVNAIDGEIVEFEWHGDDYAGSNGRYVYIGE